MSQPSFTSWVAGYSSFLTYRTPDNVGLVFEAKFHFTTDTVNQVALLLFMGQKGTMRQGSDYLAVSYIKGHVLLTWDLGAGPRRIFTPVPIDERWDRACAKLYSRHCFCQDICPLCAPGPLGPPRLAQGGPLPQHLRPGARQVSRVSRVTCHDVTMSRSVSAGKLADLNVNGEFFLGGHETYNFTRLPHDLPLHTGFTGCIFDLVLRCHRKYLDV